MSARFDGALSARLALAALLLAIVVPCALSTCPASAAEAKIELLKGDAVADLSVTTAERSSAIAIKLKNAGDAGAEVKLELVGFFRRADKKPVAARLSEGAGGGQAVPTMKIEPGQVGIFELSATLEEPGAYEATLRTSVKSGTNWGPAQQTTLVIDRQGEALSTNAIPAIEPMQVTWPSSSEWAQTIFQVQNPGNKPVLFRPPVVTGFTGPNGFAATDAARPSVAPQDCPAGDTLSPSAFCTYRLLVPRNLSSGDYKVTLEAAGINGGATKQTVVLKAKASWLLAFVAIVTGAVVAWAVQEWRTRTRPAVRQLAELAAQRRRLDNSLKDAPELGRDAIEAAFARIATIQSDIYRGADPSVAIVALGKRVDSLHAAVVATARTKRLSPRVQAIIAPRLEAAWDAFPDASSDDMQLADAAVAAWHADLKGSSAFERTLVEADTISKLYRKVRDGATQAGAVLETSKEFERQVADLCKELNADETIASRSEAVVSLVRQAESETDKLLDAWSQSLKTRIDQLPYNTNEEKAYVDGLRSKFANTGSPDRSDRAEKLASFSPPTHPARAESAATSQGTQLNAPAIPTNLDWVTLLLPVRGLSEEDLAAYERRWDMLTNLAVLTAIGLGGVVTVWANNPTWGTLGDVASAFLGGGLVRFAAEVTTQAGTTAPTSRPLTPASMGSAPTASTPVR